MKTTASDVDDLFIANNMMIDDDYMPSRVHMGSARHMLGWMQVVVKRFGFPVVAAGFALISDDGDLYYAASIWLDDSANLDFLHGSFAVLHAWCMKHFMLGARSSELTVAQAGMAEITSLAPWSGAHGTRGLV